MQWVPAAHGAVVVSMLPLANAVAGVLRAGERLAPRFWLFSLLLHEHVSPGTFVVAVWCGWSRLLAGAAPLPPVYSRPSPPYVSDGWVARKQCVTTQPVKMLDRF